METICVFLMLCLGVHSSASELLQRQKRNWIIDSFTIDEGYNKTFPYSLGVIKVTSNVNLFKIHGSGVDEEPKGILQINQKTGEITVHGPVDYEKHKVLKLVFQALDKVKNVNTQLGIEILILDSNDNPPMFDHEIYEISIKESTLQGTELVTVQAIDYDSDEKNKMFVLRIVSVTPNPQDLEFCLTQMEGSQTGTISFKGCLDHEKADKYTIIVEAKDRGQPKNLSSFCTVIINVEDGNNHLPVITGHTGDATVKEEQENILVTRLKVTDLDAKGTAAWKAKFQIQGDTDNNFKITTDPETNEGLLYVEKGLNYEDSPLKNVTLVVENDTPYYSCKVVSRSTSDLWKLDTISGVTSSSSSYVSGMGQTVALSTYFLKVTIEDVNDPPVFDKSNKQVKLGENTAAGQYLETFTATDPDLRSKSTIVYMIGEDPAGWVTVDPVTGKITTSKMVDRESSFVKDNIYKVTVYAVDNGKPPATSTATLNIFVTDENDNAPSLTVSTIDMCQSSGPSFTNITAFDKDGDPYGGPFYFKLDGDVQGKWRIDPDKGYSVNLVKENTVHSGHHELLLLISDLQGETSVHNLSVTVCECLDTARPNCRIRRATGATAGGGVIGIALFCMLLFAGILLLAVLLSCKKPITAFPDDSTEQHLMVSNSEMPGNDCKVAFLLNQEDSNMGKQITKTYQTIKTTGNDTAKHGTGFLIGNCIANYGQNHMSSEMKAKDWMGNLCVADSAGGAAQTCSKSSLFRSKTQTEQTFTRRSDIRRSMGASSSSGRLGLSTGRIRGGISNYSEFQGNYVIQREILLKALNKVLCTLQAPGEELGDYAPHVYAEEGDTNTRIELDAISIPEIAFDPDMDLDLDLKFSTLAKICMGNDITAYSEEKNSYVISTHQTITQIQVD